MNLLMLAVMEMASVASVIAAAVLAYHDKAGWGWFLVVACLLTVSGVKTKKAEEP